MSATDNLTIVTVAGPNDAPYVSLNIEHIHALNPRTAATIFVINNGGIIEAKSLAATVREGTPPPLNAPPEYRGSYQHAAALNQFVRQHSHTRYLLVLDPDFYVIAPNWIARMLEHMQSNGLAFFGAPWHPRWYAKYRYFPCPHFLCVDMHRIAPELLDFTPDLIPQKAKPGFYSLLRQYPTIKLLSGLTWARRRIGRAKDTGYRIYKRFHHLPVSLLQPVMVQDINGAAVPHLSWRVGHMLETMLPESISFFPRRPGYFSERGLATFGLPDLNAHQWEEFLWQGQPFGFHLRRFVKGARDVSAELEMLKQVLERMIHV